MDNNNFEKEQQKPVEESEKQTVENRPAEETPANSEYYDNGPKLPRSEVRTNTAKIGSVISNKDKLSVIIAMGALALILISVVMLITFCGGASGHDHNYTYSLDKDGDNFVLVGKCTVDGCSNPNFSDRNLKDVTLTEQVNATCLSGGKNVYSYEKDGVVYVYEEITGEAKSHTVNGKSIDELRNEDGSLNYDPTCIVPYADVKITCGITADGVFTCPDCGTNVPTKVRIDCAPVDEWIPVYGNVATCVKDGKEALLCRYCNKALETRTAAALGHDITHVLRRRDNKFLVVSVCSRCVEGGSEVQVLPTDSALKIKEVVPASCANPAMTTYTYTMADGEVLETTVESGTALGKCIVAGKEYTAPTEAVAYNTPGLHIYPNQESGDMTCGGQVDGYFVCEVCKKPTPPVKVKMPGEHTFGKVEPDSFPNKNQGGNVKVVCKICQKTYKVIPIEPIPENLMGSGYTLDEAANENHGGKYKYSATKDGILIEFTVTLKKEATTP